MELITMRVDSPAKILEMIKARMADAGVDAGLFEEMIKSGKRMPVGTVAEWGGKRYRKVSEGQWSPVSDGGRGSEGHGDKPGGGKHPEMSTEDKEDMANDYVSTPEKLKKRFDEAMAELGDSSKKLFVGGKLNHDKKMLVSRDGRFALKWSTRFNPGAPEGEGNVQSPKGAVKVVKLEGGVQPKADDTNAKGQQYAQRDAQRKQAAKEALSQRLGYRKSCEHILVLGKSQGLPIGTLHTWHGKKYQKQGDGSWKRVSENKVAQHEASRVEDQKRLAAHIDDVSSGDASGGVRAKDGSAYRLFSEAGYGGGKGFGVMYGSKHIGRGDTSEEAAAVLAQHMIETDNVPDSMVNHAVEDRARSDAKAREGVLDMVGSDAGKRRGFSDEMFNEFLDWAVTHPVVYEDMVDDWYARRNQLKPTVEGQKSISLNDAEPLFKAGE